MVMLCNKINGITIYIIFCFAQLLNLKIESRKTKFIVDIMPHMVFWGVVLISDRIFASATSNVEDVGKITIDVFWQNIQYYNRITKKWILSIFPFGGHLYGEGVCLVVYILIIIGILTYTKRENIYLLVLLTGTYIVLYQLNYTQGLRYVFNALPLLLMYAAYGINKVFLWIISVLPKAKKYMVGLVVIDLIIMVGKASNTVVAFATENKGDRNEVKTGAYSESAKDIYLFICSNIEEEAIIAFSKPRAIYLNTNRLSLYPTSDRYEEYGADYLLVYEPWQDTEEKIREIEKCIEEGNYVNMYANESFTLYRKKAE